MIVNLFTMFLYCFTIIPILFLSLKKFESESLSFFNKVSFLEKKITRRSDEKAKVYALSREYSWKKCAESTMDVYNKFI